MKRLILLPGWGFTACVWQELLAALSHLGAAFEVQHASTLADPPADFTAESVLCGWSLGALVALAAARQRPCAGLVLIAATPRFTQAEDWPHGWPPAALADFRQQLNENPAGLQRRFTALIARGDAQSKALQRCLPALYAQPADRQDRPDADLNAGLEKLVRLDLRPAIEAITVPTLLLHGEHDALIPLSAARWLAERLPAAQLAVFSTCGHAPLLTQPERCATLIDDFLYKQA